MNYTKVHNMGLLIKNKIKNTTKDVWLLMIHTSSNGFRHCITLNMIQYLFTNYKSIITNEIKQNM